MRIISGKNKGRKIVAPQNLPVRPTTDMAKESLFNLLANNLDLEGLSVLDLFAGTGNISFECASRGCRPVVAVDHDFKCIRFIKQVADQLNFDSITVVQADYKHFLTRSHQRWEFIFADPPYSMDEISSIHSLIFENKLLQPGGILVIEHDVHINFMEYEGLFDHRKYGKVNFSFFRNSEEG